MCIKVDKGMECQVCGYPMSEAFFLEVAGINCDATFSQFLEVFNLYQWDADGVPHGRTIYESVCLSKAKG